METSPHSLLISTLENVLCFLMRHWPRPSGIEDFYPAFKGAQLSLRLPGLRNRAKHCNRFATARDRHAFSALDGPQQFRQVRFGIGRRNFHAYIFRQSGAYAPADRLRKNAGATVEAGSFIRPLGNNPFPGFSPMSLTFPAGLNWLLSPDHF